MKNRPRWYVVQVCAGREETARMLIEQVACEAEAGMREADACEADASEAGMHKVDACENEMREAEAGAETREVDAEMRVVDACAGEMREAGAEIGMRESSVCADEPCVRECFVPKYEVMINFRGEWVRRTKALFPGYLIVVTSDVDRLDQMLRRVPAFTKLLGNDDGFIPLEAQEIDWISAFTQKGRRVVEMSEGVQEGDEITILKGPLMGHAGWIKSVNRRKRLAYLEIQMFGRTITTKVGLNLVRKKS